MKYVQSVISIGVRMCMERVNCFWKLIFELKWLDVSLAEPCAKQPIRGAFSGHN